ncbi:hypothetical protein LXA43DRAFT_1059138 [Ganoderma leucocontextum]|nr:hypothetical protein LXA43DRAFT_1059138 [Ganoderma leucocontextum]
MVGGKWENFKFEAARHFHESYQGRRDRGAVGTDIPLRMGAINSLTSPILPASPFVQPNLPPKMPNVTTCMTHTFSRSNDPCWRDCASDSETVASEASEPIGSKTKIALLKLAKENSPTTRRRATSIFQMTPFSNERKAMGVVVRLDNAATVVTLRRHIVVERGSKQSGDIETVEIDGFALNGIQRTIIFYATQTPRTIAIYYRFRALATAGVHAESLDEVPYEVLSQDFMLLAITGIEDSLCLGVVEERLEADAGGSIQPAVSHPPVDTLFAASVFAQLILPAMPRATRP